MAFTYRYVRVTPQNKVEDRFLTVQVSKPDDPAKLSYGAIFNLVEITSRWFPTSQIAQAIINTLRREYFRGASTSDLENFENAIKKVNEQLATITQQGETEWIGKLNACLVLLNGNQAHLCATGNIRALLIRQSAAITIVQPNQDSDDVPPLKTFSTITSGSLHDRDKIVVGSSALPDFIGTEDLKDAFGQPTVYQAAVALVRQLKRQRVRHICLNAIEILQETSASGLPLGEPEVIYLDQPIESPARIIARTASQYLLPAVSRAAVVGKKVAKATAQIFKTHVIPTSAQIAKQLHHHARSTAKQLVEKGGPIAQQTIAQVRQQTAAVGKRIGQLSEESPTEKTNSPRFEQAGSLIGKTIFNIHDYTKAKPKRKLAIPLPSALVWQRLLLFARQRRNRPLLYIAGTIALVFILVLSISIQKKNEKAIATKQQATSSLEEAKQRLEEGKTALIFNNKNQAQLAFADSIKLAKQTIGSNNLSAEAKKIISSAETELDKLVGSNRLKDLKPSVTFQAADNIVAHQGKIIALDKTDNRIYLGDLVDGSVQQINARLDGKIVAATLQKDTAILLTETNLYNLNIAKLAVEKTALAQDVSVKKGIGVANFIDNIYILSPAENQIWKYQPKDGALGQAAPFIKGQAKISNAKAMTIDGSIYVMANDGKLTKFSQGSLQQFSFQGLPQGMEKIEQPVTVFTSQDSSSLYLVESGALPRILEFDKQGKFLQQFLFQSDLENLKDVWFLGSGRKAWALFGNSVYELNL